MKKSQILIAILASTTLATSTIIPALNPVANAAKTYKPTKHQYDLDGRTTITNYQYAQALQSISSRNVPYFAGHIINTKDGIVYYYIDHVNSDLRDSIHKAISNWNNLGVIKFVETSDRTQANVFLHNTRARKSAYLDPLSYERLSVNANTYDGITVFGEWDDTNGNSHPIADINIDYDGICTDFAANPKEPKYLDSVITHELGHSLGLEHDHTVTKLYATRTHYRFNKFTGKIVKTVNNHYFIRDVYPVMAPGSNRVNHPDARLSLGVAEQNWLKAHYPVAK